jgi:hypothetical protein
MSLDTWTHIVCTQDIHRKYQIYVNGQLESYTGRGFTESGPIINAFTGSQGIGINTLGNGTFTGSIDQFCVWNRPLNAQEVALLYNSGSGLTYPF